MNGSRASMLAAGLLAAAAAAMPAPATAGAASSAERKARAACVAEARQLKAKVPAGACNDPASRMKFLTAAREACARSMMAMPGQSKCRRDAVDDK